MDEDRKYKLREYDRERNKKRRVYNKKFIEEWKKNNPEKYKESNQKSAKKYYDTNPEFYICKAKLRRKKMKSYAIPTWVNMEKIREIYKKAKELGKITNVMYEIDHIIPLKNEKVCGFHIWENLQVLSRTENRKKGNKYYNEF